MMKNSTSWMMKKQYQLDDEEYKQVATYRDSSWPKKVPSNDTPYYHVTPKLSLTEGLLMRGEKIVIPTS